MIRIDVSSPDLAAAIEAKKPGWAKDAKVKTKAAIAAGKVGEGDGTWSEIKEVFILKQHYKCIYCESPMAKARTGTAELVAVEYDVEHFRPKNRVVAWPSPAVLTRRPGIDYANRIGSGPDEGYVRLAFDPTNYMVSCKVCNSSLKADHFPMTGTPDRKSKKRASLDQKERPLLLFPFGSDGDDPQRVLEFQGALIRPRAAGAVEGFRARVVIDFFELDTREDLLEGRAQFITLLWPQLEETLDLTAPGRPRALSFVTTVQEDRFPHAACARAFVALHGADRPRARQLYDAALDYWITKDPQVFHRP